LDDGTELPVSRQKKMAVKTALVWNNFSRYLASPLMVFQTTNKKRKSIYSFVSDSFNITKQILL